MAILSDALLKSVLPKLKRTSLENAYKIIISPLYSQTEIHGFTPTGDPVHNAAPDAAPTPPARTGCFSACCTSLSIGCVLFRAVLFPPIFFPLSWLRLVPLLACRLHLLLHRRRRPSKAPRRVVTSATTPPQLVPVPARLGDAPALGSRTATHGEAAPVSDGLLVPTSSDAPSSDKPAVARTDCAAFLRNLACCGTRDANPTRVLH